LTSHHVNDSAFFSLDRPATAASEPSVELGAAAMPVSVPRIRPAEKFVSLAHDVNFLPYRRSSWKPALQHPEPRAARHLLLVSSASDSGFYIATGFDGESQADASAAIFSVSSNLMKEDSISRRTSSSGFGRTRRRQLHSRLPGRPPGHASFPTNARLPPCRTRARSHSRRFFSRARFCVLPPWPRREMAKVGQGGV